MSDEFHHLRYIFFEGEHRPSIIGKSLRLQKGPNVEVKEFRAEGEISVI
jgi:hypothetical protein